jgi:predicted dithiol-disulfide oxidoreductase (DUF899 family)
MNKSSKATSTGHKVVSRKAWLAERSELLKAEKALTRRSDKLAKQRQALPWVRIEKEYRFETEKGKVPFADLFQGRSQLLIYHFMFGADYNAGCPSCSAIADGFNGFAIHLANHDVTLSAVSRAPFAKVKAYKQRMGWNFPWASSMGSDFNADFGVAFTAEQQKKGDVVYNYEPNAFFAQVVTNAPEPVVQFATSCGTDAATYLRELPGMSTFVLEDGVIYHAYSSYSRGLDGLWGMYQWLDRAPKGRNEDEGIWWRRNDEYGSQDKKSGPSCCQPAD